MPLLAPVTHSIAVVCQPGGDAEAAARLAAICNVPVAQSSQADWALVFNDQGVSLQPADKSLGVVRVDFVGGKLGYRRRRQEAKPTIAKALGVKTGEAWQVWDMTAGLGQDAFVLASLGCRVSMFERHPLVHCLLADGLTRARQAAETDPGLAAIMQRLSLQAQDARDIIEAKQVTEAEASPDMIYLDPMFPPRKKSAKVNNAMQVFHQLVGADTDADELLYRALQLARYRVVVKRPAGAPSLSGERQPGFQLGGKTVRYDVYPLEAIPKEP